MSALLGTIYDDRIELAADGGTFTSEGVLTGLTRKLWASPTLPLVVGGVGGSGELEMLTHLVDLVSNGLGVDQTLETLKRVLPNRGEVSAPIPFELVIACCSERQGLQIWRWRNLRPDDNALPELRQSFNGVIAFGPGLSPDEMLAAGYDSDDFKATALGLMAAMRAKECRPAFLDGLDADEAHYVAGHVDHAVVTAAGATIERICEWPDVVGERVRP